MVAEYEDKADSPWNHHRLDSHYSPIRLWGLQLWQMIMIIIFLSFMNERTISFFFDVLHSTTYIVLYSLYFLILSRKENSISDYCCYQSLLFVTILVQCCYI